MHDLIQTQTEIKVRAIAVNQPIGTFFIASLSAKQIIDISGAHIRKLEKEEANELDKYTGIQRQLSQARVKELKDYVNTIDATFPSSIILSVEQENSEWDEETGFLTLKPSQNIAYDNIAQIIDGQHRIEGLRYLTENPEFNVNVSIFVGIDIATQAYIFATVNLAQTKVNRSLVYDLYEHEHNPSPFKSAHDVAVALDKLDYSPFNKRIKRLGVKTPNREYEPLTQAAVVEAILAYISKDPYKDRDNAKRKIFGKNPPPSIDELKTMPFRGLYFSDNEKDIVHILINYFKAVEKKWPKKWSDFDTKGNVLPKTNGFQGLMRLFKDVYLEIVGNEIGTVPSEEDFFKVINIATLKEEEFNIQTFPPGGSGSSQLYSILHSQIFPSKQRQLNLE